MNRDIGNHTLFINLKIVSTKRNDAQNNINIDRGDLKAWSSTLTSNQTSTLAAANSMCLGRQKVREENNRS